MKKYEFEELKNQYYTITEAIKLYDSGNHSEYDEDDLNEELDNIHVEICEAASDIAQYLINKIDNDYNGEEVKMTDKDFESYWQKNRLQILKHNDSYNKATQGYKMTSGADYLLFGIPVATGIICIDYLPLQNEILKWICSAVITILCFAICVWIKTAITATETPDEIEKRIKKATHDIWKKKMAEHLQQNK